MYGKNEKQCVWSLKRTYLRRFLIKISHCDEVCAFYIVWVYSPTRYCPPAYCPGKFFRDNSRWRLRSVKDWDTGRRTPRRFLRTGQLNSPQCLTQKKKLWAFFFQCWCCSSKCVKKFKKAIKNAFLMPAQLPDSYPDSIFL